MFNGGVWRQNNIYCLLTKLIPLYLFVKHAYNLSAQGKIALTPFSLSLVIKLLRICLARREVGLAQL